MFIWILLFALIYLNLNSEEHHKSYGFESDENESINRLLYLVFKKSFHLNIKQTPVLEREKNLVK